MNLLHDASQSGGSSEVGSRRRSGRGGVDGLTHTFEDKAARTLFAEGEIAAALAAVAEGKPIDLTPSAVARLAAWHLVSKDRAHPRLTRLGRTVAYHLGECRAQLEESTAQALTRLLEVRRDNAVLDVGCGAGQTLAALSAAEPRLHVGVEYDPVALAMFPAMRDHAGRGRGVAVRGNAEMLPFRDGTFDRVLCRVVLMFVRVPAVLSEAARVTRPGGLLYLHLTDGWFFLRKLLRGELERGGVPFALLNGALLHVLGVQVAAGARRTMNFQTIAGVRRQLRALGFKIESVIAERGSPLRAAHVQPKILARRL